MPTAEAGKKCFSVDVFPSMLFESKFHEILVKQSFFVGLYPLIIPKSFFVPNAQVVKVRTALAVINQRRSFESLVAK